MKVFLALTISAFTFLTSCSLIGSTRTAMIDTPEIPDIFESVCIGRYQMDMPKKTQLTDATFRAFDMKTGFAAPSQKQPSKGGFYLGSTRKKNWIAHVNTQLGEQSTPANVIRNIQNETSHITTLKWLFEEPGDDPDPTDMTNTLAYKDFPTAKLGLGFKLKETEKTFFRHIEGPYQHKLDNLLRPISNILDLYKHLPWPHNQLGVCLTKDITFNTARAAEDEYLRVIYRFREKTFFQFYIQAYARDQHAELHDEISSKLGALSLFASDYFNFGGRTGKLFLSGDVYSPTATRFRWYATDAVAGSTQKPFISIEGRVDVNDFPELKGLNNIDSNAIALSLLASFQPRENGLVGTR